VKAGKEIILPVGYMVSAGIRREIFSCMLNQEKPHMASEA
jgi:hypothetical protein